MLFAIHAYENSYQSLHGIEDSVVTECINYEEACEIAHEMSLEVMHDYCYDDYDSYDEEELEENVCYEIWAVKENSKSLDELNEMFYNDMESFVAKYCKEV